MVTTTMAKSNLIYITQLHISLIQFGLQSVQILIRLIALSYASIMTLIIVNIQILIMISVHTNGGVLP